MLKHLPAVSTLLSATFLWSGIALAQEPTPAPVQGPAPVAPLPESALPADVTPPAAAPAAPTLPSTPEQKATAPALTSAPPTSPQTASAAPAPPASIASMGPKGLTVQSDDARFSFNIRFPFMFDAKATINDRQPKAGDAFYPRFFGPIFTVTLYKAVTGKLIVGFSDKSVNVVNAWMDFAAHPLLHLRLGKFLYPIALERQVLPLKAVLLEHGLASQLLPVSEFGAQLWGATAKKEFEYQLTFGNGAPTNQHYESDLDTGKDGIGRIYLRPFAGTDIGALKGLGFGVGASYGIRHGSAANPLTGSLRTLGGRTFYNTAVGASATDPAGTAFADGKVVRLVPQLGYLAGPVSLVAEYVRLNERLSRGNVKTSLTHQSVHGILTVVLTGENAVQLDIPAPKRPFDLAAGQFGALELVARAEHVQFDKETFPRYANPASSAESATAFGGGFNWIPTEIIRVMLNYERTSFGTAPGGKKLRDENLLGLRVQALF